MFQRPYAWTTDEVDELLDDLLFAMRRDDEEPYFLGSIVLIKGDDAHSQVVDGQQRLTTLTMLLCVMRELAEESEIRSALDERIRQQRDVLSGAKEVVRISLRQQDRKFFYDHVQSTGGIKTLLDDDPPKTTDSQDRIFENVKRLHASLSELSKEERRGLAAFIVQRCYLVLVQTSDMTSAYRIFSVMNDRGLDLSATDILKAEVIGDISDADSQRSYANKWEDIEQELGRESFGDLFAHVRTVYAKAKQRRSLEEEFREYVLKRHTATEFIDSILDEYDDAYKSVLGLPGGIIASTAIIEDRLRSLRRLDNVDWIPPAMAFYHRHRRDQNGLERFTQDLERLAYGMFILRVNVTDRIRRYGTVLTGIEQGDSIWADGGPLQLNRAEAEGVVTTLNGPIYTLPRVPRPLLLKLDGLLTEPGATVEHSIITIEHVLPQNPAENSLWRTWFHDDEVRQFWTHRLANLALLSRRKKRECFKLGIRQKKARIFLARRSHHVRPNDANRGERKMDTCNAGTAPSGASGKAGRRMAIELMGHATRRRNTSLRPSNWYLPIGRAVLGFSPRSNPFRRVIATIASAPAPSP